MVAVGLRQDPPDLTHASGNAYVPVKLKQVDLHWQRFRALGRIYVVNNPELCGHVHSMCAKCAKSWEIDYTVHYDRTGGGRRLTALINGSRGTVTPS